jgi:hypothetical protein
MDECGKSAWKKCARLIRNWNLLNKQEVAEGLDKWRRNWKQEVILGELNE